MLSKKMFFENQVALKEHGEKLIFARLEKDNNN